MNQINHSDFLTADEVSVLLRIPLRTIYNLSISGKIRGVKIGKLWRYRESDIREYINLGTEFSKEPVPSKTWDCPTGVCPLGRRTLKGCRKPEAREKPARKPGNLIERRTYPRINTSINCRYSIDIAPFKQTEGQGIIKNISAGGVFFAVASDLIEIGDPVDLRFTIGGQMDLNGRVVRKDNSGLGIKFRNISNEYKERIVEYVG